MDVLKLKGIDEQKLKRTVWKVLQWLVSGEYLELEKLAQGSGLTAAMIQAGVDAWPGKIVMPPEDKLDELIYIIELDDVAKKWSVDYDCWTIEQGHSDLTIAMIFTETNQEYYDVDLRDIDVL